MYGKSKVEAADIIKILSKPNVINSSAEHAGEVLQIDITEQSYDNINLNNKLLTGIKKFISFIFLNTFFQTSTVLTDLTLKLLAGWNIERDNA